MVAVIEISKTVMLNLWAEGKLIEVVVIGTDVYARTRAEIHKNYGLIVHCGV